MANVPEMDQRYNLYFALAIGGIAILLGLYALIVPFVTNRKSKLVVISKDD